MIGDHELLAHRDPTCTGGFSAVVTRRTVRQDDWVDELPVQVELRCWNCLTSYEITTITRAIDQAETEDYRPPAEHQPFLSGLWDRELCIAAAFPTEKHGAVVLHPELVGTWRREVLWWLAADRDGNVVGQVDRYTTVRGATRYRWGTWGVTPGGDGFSSARSACKALATAVGL